MRDLPLEGTVGLRYVDPSARGKTSFSVSLCPTSMNDYIGQEKIRDNLSIAVSAAKRRKEPLDHILLHGPPGLGKTTLAGVVAAELGVTIRGTSGPVLERPGSGGYPFES